MRTRYWDNPDGTSSTAVQFRTDVKPMVWLHSNIGWLPISNTPEGESAAEAFAEKMAKGYNLEERDQQFAKYMLGLEKAPECYSGCEDPECPYTH